MRVEQNSRARKNDQDINLALKWAAGQLRRAKAAGDRTIPITPRTLLVLVQAARTAERAQPGARIAA